MVGSWPTWTKIDFNPAKCFYFYETYQGRNVIHPDIDLTINGAQLKKANMNTTVWYLGLQVQLDQLPGSGSCSVRIDDLKNPFH